MVEKAGLVNNRGRAGIIFVSKSLPFKDSKGKDVCSVSSMINKKTQAKKGIMREKKMTGKQFRAWVKQQRRVESALAGEGLVNK